MELQDIKSYEDIQAQTGIYGTMTGQVADNLQDLKKIVAKKKNIEEYSEILNKLDEAQHNLYVAARILAEIEDK